MMTRLGITSLMAVLALAGCPANSPPMNFVDSGPGGIVDMAMPVDLGPCGACADPKPLCDTKTKKCVACLVDNDCGDATVCKAGACVPGCTLKHSECGDAGSCDLDGGSCHGCLADRDC